MLFIDLTYYTGYLGAVGVRGDVSALKWDGACADGACADGAYLDEACLDRACLGGACTDGAYTDRACCRAYYGA